MDNKMKVLFALAVVSTLFMVGAINLTVIWELVDEIVNNMDKIVNLVIVGVVIGVAVGIGAFIRGALDKGLKSR